MAELTGHEDALFGCSGTMTNQLALRCWLRGALESVVLDARAHIHKYENAGIAYHSQAGVTTVRPRAGSSHLTLDRIRANIIDDDVHCAKTRVVALENTLNGGIFDLEEIKRIADFTKQRDLILHCDGARLWNASAETEIPLKDWCAPFDTVSLCLSKGVGAPVGSILVGIYFNAATGICTDLSSIL
jgi:threonine aldolase